MRLAVCWDASELCLERALDNAPILASIFFALHVKTRGIILHK